MNDDPEYAGLTIAEMIGALAQLGETLGLDAKVMVRGYELGYGFAQPPEALTVQFSEWMSESAMFGDYDDIDGAGEGETVTVAFIDR